MAENRGVQNLVQLLGEDKKVSVTVFLPCPYCLAEVSSPCELPGK